MNQTKCPISWPNIKANSLVLFTLVFNIIKLRLGRVFETKRGSFIGLSSTFKLLNTYINDALILYPCFVISLYIKIEIEVTMYTINNLIATLLTVGGVGYINFYTLDHMGLISSAKEDKSRVLPISLVCSLIDFAIYLCMQQWLKNQFHDLSVKGNGSWLIFWTVILTMLIAFVATLVFGNIGVKSFYFLVNLTRKSEGKAELIQESPFEELMSEEGQIIVYVYNFAHEPIGFGLLSSASADKNSHYQLNLVPTDNGTTSKQLSYDDINEYSQSREWNKTYEITQHINFQQQFILFFLKVKIK